MVALNVKNHSVVFNNTGGRVILSNISWRIPICSRGFSMPRFKLFLTIWMFFPKFPKNLFCNYSHSVDLNKFTI